MRIYAWRRFGHGWGLGTGIRLRGLYLVIGIVAAFVSLWDWPAAIGLAFVIAMIYVIRSLERKQNDPN